MDTMMMMMMTTPSSFGEHLDSTFGTIRMSGHLLMKLSYIH